MKQILKNVFSVLKNRKFWFNIIGVFVLFFILTWGMFRYLRSYTNYGESVTVIDFKGMVLNEVEDLLKDRYLKYSIMDSIYNPDLKPYEIISQTPIPGSKVKENRTIYFTVRSLKPDERKLPDLEGISLRNAMSKLNNQGFKVNEIIYRPYEYINSVIYVSKDDKHLKPGTVFPKGTEFDLIVGNGLGSTKVSVPNLSGQTLEEAEFNLHGGYNLNIGATLYDGGVQSKTDTIFAIIYDQNPKPTDEEILRIGEFIDVWLMREEDYKALMDTMPILPEQPE